MTSTDAGATHAAALSVAVTRAERILVVDDDPDIRRLLIHNLSRIGYSVTSAADGDEALAVAARETPDLVVLDVSMPGLDGIGVCRALQRLGDAAPVVVFLSAQSELTNRVVGLDAGAVDYIVKPFDDEELRARVRAALRTKARRDALASLALTDGLTGLANRRSLETRFGELFALAHRYRRPLACLMVDVDHFKRVNDVHGHTAGDAVLREVAARLAAQCRSVDLAARYGGEEFTVVLPETDAEGALTVAERIRGAVAASDIALDAEGSSGQPGQSAIPVRVSIGVAMLTAEMGSADAMRAAADAALYTAKRTGRDRSVLAE